MLATAGLRDGGGEHDVKIQKDKMGNALMKPLDASELLSLLAKCDRLPNVAMIARGIFDPVPGSSNVSLAR